MNDQARYTVMLPSGREGPYTQDDLRHLVESRKITPDDRVFDSALRKALSVRDLVPDAERLATSGTASTRVPKPHQRSASSTGSSAAIPQTAPPAPAPVTQQTEPAVPPIKNEPGIRIPPAATTKGGGGSPLNKLPVLIVLAIIAIGAVWLAAPFAKEVFQGDPPAPPPLEPAGSWGVKELSDLGGPWHLKISTSEIAITDPKGDVFKGTATIEQESPYHAIIHLKPAHKALGDALRLSSLSGGGALIVTWRGGSELIRE